MSRKNAPRFCDKDMHHFKVYQRRGRQLLKSAVDFRADLGDGLLVDACRVPALDCPVISLPRLIATAPAPAVSAQKIGG